MAAKFPGPVVSARWLAGRLGDPAIRIVDATVHLADTGRNARTEYLHGHIPGAAFLDFVRVADPDHPLPRKCPGGRRFAAEVGALGIGNDTHVVAYDTPGLYSAAPGTRAGHIPRSRNLYWADVLDPQTRCLLPAADLRARFAAAGTDYERPAILTCGSGLTACILALALHLTGKDDWQVYDGSWDEWGRRADLPIESAPARNGESP